MQNDSMIKLKISGNRSDGGRNPLQSLNLSIIQALRHHLDKAEKLATNKIFVPNITVQTCYNCANYVWTVFQFVSTWFNNYLHQLQFSWRPKRNEGLVQSFKCCRLCSWFRLLVSC